MDDLISRQAVLDMAYAYGNGLEPEGYCVNVEDIEALPSAQPTLLYGYKIEHLELIARVLEKENLSPERVAEALTDIGRIVAIVTDEFKETLRRAVDQCVTQSIEKKQ